MRAAGQNRNLANHILIVHRKQEERNKLGGGASYKPSKLPTPSDVLPLAKFHLLEVT